MKYALLADIHGNKHALQAVLEDLQYQKIDKIMCLGDLIAIGPHSNEVLHTIMNMPNISIITGNHDEAVLSLYFNEPYPDSHKHAKPHHEWVAQQLSDDQAQYLKKSPRQITEDINDIRLLCTHYAYKQGMESSPIEKDPYKRIMEPTSQNMATLFSQNDQDIIAFGHHHPKHDFHIKGQHYINPGSLGCNDKPLARYAILSISKEGKYSIAHKEVPYNRAPLLQDYDDLSVPQRDELRKIFHGQGRSE
ncbi:metallophosphoesterase family protein [Pontibacillus marinus]|uniref:Calcineurin-like phosphoesterase domain-containing protein n=1 Tax=Pontibacillus marinus BH030004 = DSM 16465 TaxID=1385511 RepID=A0A0A5HKK8_9BACI|nr:metallophosphoesterase family protein [Pontibacillus marinus]KGX84177.1 hypothetical protein N783_18715 [Pontibacillus marinus BH030004 = DSM 16465]